MTAKRKPITFSFTDLDDSMLHGIVDAYGFQHIDSVSPILLDGSDCTLLEVRSATSQKVILNTDSGKFFLKQIPWYCDDEDRILFSHRFQESLRCSGLPVPSIIPTVEDSTYCEISGRKFVLFEYCIGRRYDGTERQRHSAACALAAIHECGFVDGIRPAEDLFQLALDHVDLLDECLVPATNACSTEFQAARAGFRANALDAFRSVVGAAREQAAQAGWFDLPAIGVHGDYSPWNVLFDDSGHVCALLDFDNSDRGCRLHDVAEALANYCILGFDGDTNRFCQAIAPEPFGTETAAFLSAYCQIAPLSSTERQCLPLAVLAVLVELFCLGMIRGDFYLNDYPAMLNYLQRAATGTKQRS